MAQKIEVVSYQSDWPEKYRKEAEQIQRCLGELFLEIHHIGSTAVLGLAAKPIIDILAVVKDIEAVDEKNPLFEALGYECMGEFGIAGRRYFRKGGDDRTHQIHIFARSSTEEILRHLAVRDYLRTHADTAKEYGRLKRQLAVRFPRDIEGYCDGKDLWMKKLEKDALDWYKKFVSP